MQSLPRGFALGTAPYCESNPGVCLFCLCLELFTAH